MAEVKEREKFKVQGYGFNKKEFNLATEFKRVIQKAFDLHPKMNYEFISEQLGISVSALGRIVKEWNINTHRKATKPKIRNADVKTSFKLRDTKYF